MALHVPCQSWHEQELILLSQQRQHHRLPSVRQASSLRADAHIILNGTCHLLASHRAVASINKGVWSWVHKSNAGSIHRLSLKYRCCFRRTLTLLSQVPSRNLLSS